MSIQVIICNEFQHGDTIYGEEKHWGGADNHWTFGQLYYGSILNCTIVSRGPNQVRQPKTIIFITRDTKVGRYRNW